jgi:formylglycine-generating enzyme required for sulfatase activity
MVPTFELMQTEVTVDTYEDCVAGDACVAIDDLPVPPPAGCVAQERDDAQGCLDRQRAIDVCTWLGGRVPSESEWEFAARSRGEDRTFPWGEEPPSCELAVLGYTDVPVWNCAEDGSARVCSRPAGNTAQGLCDMAGNIYEWVADPHHATYDGAPDDGSVWEDAEAPFYVLRGGGLNSDEPVRTTNRTFHEAEFYYSGSGVRCARDLVQ